MPEVMHSLYFLSSDEDVFEKAWQRFEVQQLGLGQLFELRPPGILGDFKTDQCRNLIFLEVGHELAVNAVHLGQVRVDERRVQHSLHPRK